GIGRATARRFAARGARVAVADIEAAAARETVALIRDDGGEAVGIQVDVADAAGVQGLVEETAAVFGRLDFAFNNAGITGEVAKIADCSEENWDRVIAVNLKGVWLCLKYELRQMLKQGGGAIVNMASVAGLVGIHDQLPAYAPSKHGVIGLTRTAALEYATDGIRINAVCPGEISTPLSEQYFRDNPERAARAVAAEPMGRFGAATEVADAVLWLCSDEASFVTGHAMAVDGGYLAQ
ncbi:MAG: SDR family oxidoreductase, partial [Gammaproteobacteria bacterium]|nr:SDR family oxidoreductase [Gammaproteobacteria bacterium]